MLLSCQALLSTGHSYPKVENDDQIQHMLASAAKLAILRRRS